MKEKKIFATVVMLSMMIASAFSMIMPAVQGVIIVSPEPDVLWKNTNSTEM